MKVKVVFLLLNKIQKSMKVKVMFVLLENFQKNGGTTQTTKISASLYIPG